MKYLIERTSGWHDEDPEVEGAYQIKVHEIYRSRSIKCPATMADNCEHIRKENDIWTGEWKEPANYWAIDIDSLDELNALVNKVGYPLIISKSNNTEDLMRIEIYDDYRE